MGRIDEFLAEHAAIQARATATAEAVAAAQRELAEHGRKYERLVRELMAEVERLKAVASLIQEQERGLSAVESRWAGEKGGAG